MRVPGGGASCLGVGRPGMGALPPPTSRPLGRAAGADYPLAVGAGGAGVGTRLQLHSARSCVLWGRHEGAWGGPPLPWGGASGVGRSPIPDHPSFRACGWSPLPTGCGCGVRAWGPGCPWHLVPCGGSSSVVLAFRVRGSRWTLWLGTCPRAVVVAGSVPLWHASWPRFGAPLLVRSGRSRCSSWLSRRRGAFPHPGGCRPWLYWVAVRGTWRLAETRAHCACRWPLPRQGRWARSASYLFGAPRWSCPWRVPLASVSGCVHCGGLACVDPVTDASSFPYRPSCDRGLGRCTGADLCGRRDRPLRVGGRHARVPRVCACACPAWPGRVGRPPGRVLVRLTFHLAVPGSLLACSAHSGLGLPCLWLLLIFFFPSPPSFCPRCVLLCVFSGPWCLGPWRFVAPPPLFFLPPPPVVSSCCLVFFPLFLVFPFSVFVFPFLVFPVVRCGAGLCVLGRGVCPRVSPWCCPCRCSVCAGWCCVVFAVGPGCPLLSPGGSWWLAALWFGVVCLGVLLPCVVFCCVVLSCGGVLSCSAVCLRRCLRLLFVYCRCASAVCDLGGRAVCSLPSLPCAVLCALCWFPFRCAVRVVCAVSGGWCCWFLVLLPFVGGLLVALVAGVVFCRCVSALVPVSGLAVARRLPCGVLLPCALSCGAVLPCGAVLWCPVFFFCFSSCLWRWFFCCSLLVLGSGQILGPFCFCALPVRCCAGVPASLLLFRCSLALAGLADVLCCCLLRLCVCCRAWLSSVVSWWVLVAPGVVSRWLAVVCPWVLCCALLLRVVPPGVALLCAVLFPFAPFGAAARCVVS